MARLGATASKPWKSSATIKLTHRPLAINPTDAVAVGNRCSRKGVGCRLDGEPDRLRCGRKAAIAQRLSCPALALAHEQLSGYAVVECHSLAVGRFCVHVEFYHGNRPERIVWTPSERASISRGRPCRPGPRSRHRAERDSARRARSRSQGLLG